MKKIFFSVTCIAFLICGVTAFNSCDKENQTSLNSSHQITKSDNVSYNSLVEDHDYSISIEGENINYTAYGRLNCDVESVREVVDGVEYKGLRYITVDENIHSISKINENSLEVKIDD